jgi:hypothetical protein
MSLKKKHEKSPYKVHRIEEVMQAEAGRYYIQIGDSIFNSDTGKLAFNKERVEYFFAAVYEGLRDIRKNGDEQDREDALHCLLNFRIIPLRFH